MITETKKGIYWALMTAFISGFSIFYNKLIIVQGIDPSSFNIIKNGGAAILISLFVFSSNSRRELFKLSLRSWGMLLTIGVIGGSLPFMLYFEGLKIVPAINAGLIHKSMFLWVALIALPFLKERLNLWQVAGYLLIAVSNLVIGGFTGFAGSLGEIMILTATLFWSVENIIAKKTLDQVAPAIVAWGRMFLGFVILAIVAAFQNKIGLLFKLTPSQILPIAGSIIFLTGYVITWFKGLKLAPVTTVTSVLILSTPITNILSSFFITHNFNFALVINLLATVSGLLLIVFLASPSKEKTLAPNS